MTKSNKQILMANPKEARQKYKSVSDRTPVPDTNPQMETPTSTDSEMTFILGKDYAYTSIVAFQDRPCHITGLIIPKTTKAYKVLIRKGGEYVEEFCVSEAGLAMVPQYLGKRIAIQDMQRDLMAADNNLQYYWPQLSGMLHPDVMQKLNQALDLIQSAERKLDHFKDMA